MNFFQAQDDARRRTRRMVVLFFLAVLSIALAIYGVVVFAKFYILNGSFGGAEAVGLQIWQPLVLVWTFFGVVGLVTLCAAGKIAQLRSGGGAVARSAGGKPVDPATSDPDERKLLNIVEEMAIASGTPMPEVFILEEEGINGFAAGFQPADAAIAVTRGCIRSLSRDELQGVVAHEFSHILNGDMRLNIRLCGVLFGILAIAVAGRLILRGTAEASLFSGSRKSKEGGGLMLVILMVSIAVIAIGYIGVLFGRLIQSAISRQREFLADAAAVQFTRNPDSIGGALRKIGGSARRGQIRNPHAEELAHCFFASALQFNLGGSFATHPPLEERIRAIDPNWDGKFAAPSEHPAAPPAEADSDEKDRRDPEAFIQAIGTLGAASVLYAGQIRKQIEPLLQNLRKSPEAAGAALLALIITAGDAEDPEGQFHQLERALEADAIAEVRRWLPELRRLDLDQRFALLELALPQAVSRNEDQLVVLEHCMRELARADDTINLEELALLRIVRNFVDCRRNPGQGPRHLSPKELQASVQLTLSALVHSARLEGEAARHAYTAGISQANRLLRDEPALLSADQIDTEALDQALGRFARLPGPEKKIILEAAVHTVLADAQVEAEERSLIRAIAASMNLPMPPLPG